MKATASWRESLPVLLRALKLPGFAAGADEMTQRTEKEGLSFPVALHHLAEQELAERARKRITRLMKGSGLPAEKTLATLDLAKLPEKVRHQLPSLSEGNFLSDAVNILAFGLPGRGKTHAVCAIGHELVNRGHKVLFTPAYRLVQRLLRAKRDLALEAEMKKLDNYDAVILDDIGYIQQDRNEMEVLFTFLAERYERKSVIITSNLVFSQWDKIFTDPMTTAAAIDRIVHHSVILDFSNESERANAAKQRARSATSKNKGEEPPKPKE